MSKVQNTGRTVKCSIRVAVDVYTQIQTAGEIQ